jgi:hypothetical protein
VLEHVELVAVPALTLSVIHREGAVADHARERDAVPVPDVEAVAADVATEEEFMTGRYRVAKARVPATSRSPMLRVRVMSSARSAS